MFRPSNNGARESNPSTCPGPGPAGFEPTSRPVSGPRAGLLCAPRVLLAAAALIAVAACGEQGTTDSGGAVETSAHAAEAPPPDDSGERREDQRLAAAVLAQFAADPQLDAADFDVEVQRGSARVRSRATRASDWARARAIAGLVPGVREVAMLDSAPPSGSGDEQPGAAPVELRDIEAVYADAVVWGTALAEPLALPVEGSGTQQIAHAASGGRPRTYVVRAGDNLSAIARRTMGDGLAWPRIYELNRSVIGPNPQALRAGMELRIPQD